MLYRNSIGSCSKDSASHNIYFVYCIIEIYLQGENLAISLYEVKWHLLPLEDRRAFIIMLQQIQQPIVITLLGTQKLNVETGQNVTFTNPAILFADNRWILFGTLCFRCLKQYTLLTWCCRNLFREIIVGFIYTIAFSNSTSSKVTWNT